MMQRKGKLFARDYSQVSLQARLKTNARLGRPSRCDLLNSVLFGKPFHYFFWFSRSYYKIQIPNRLF